MKTYVCDMCRCFVGDPIRNVHMRELSFYLKPSKKQRIHLCSKCWMQIADVSRKKRSDENDRT
jgi:hypothetical protein